MRTFHLTQDPKNKKLSTRKIKLVDGRDGFRVRLNSRDVRKLRRSGADVIAV